MPNDISIDELLAHAAEAIRAYPGFPCKAPHTTTEENSALNALRAWTRLRMKWGHGGFRTMPKEDQEKYLVATRRLQEAGMVLLGVVVEPEQE